MTQHRSRIATPADLARLKQQLGDGSGPVPSSRRAKPALLEYAYLGHVRTAEERRLGGGEPDYLDRLAEVAEDEDRDGLDASFPGEKQILRSYVQLTFERIQQQGEVRASPGNAYSAFNTGLSTPRQETIYGVFRHRASGRQFQGWFEESARIVLDNFPDLPDFAIYTEEPADYMYD